MNQEAIDRFVIATALMKQLKPALEKHDPSNLRGLFEAEYKEHLGQDARLPITAPDGSKVGDFFPEHYKLEVTERDELVMDLDDDELADWVRDNVFELFTFSAIEQAINDYFDSTGEVPPRVEVESKEHRVKKTIPSRAVIKVDEVMRAYQSVLPEPVRALLEDSDD